MNKHHGASEGMQGLKVVRQQLHSRRAYLRKQVSTPMEYTQDNMAMMIAMNAKVIAYSEALNMVNRQIEVLKLTEKVRKYRRKVKQ